MKNNSGKSSRFFIVSPWLLAAATALLIFIVLTFTLNNMQREKELMTRGMVQKGATLMRVTGSGTRSAQRADLRHGIRRGNRWQEYIQRIISHLAEDPEVLFLMLMDDHNRIIAHSDSEKIGSLAAKLKDDLPPPTRLEKNNKNRPELTFRINEYGEYGRIFLISRPFLPFLPFQPSMPPHRMHMHDCVEGEPCPPLPEPIRMERKRFKNMRQNGQGKELYTVVIGLDMEKYDKSLQRLRFQAIMLSLTMLLVGVGGWLSLAAVQGYRVSQEALSDIQAFTGLLVSRLPIGIIATDQHGRVSTWNQAAAEMISVHGKEALGKMVEKSLPKELARFFAGDYDSGKEAVEGSEISLNINENSIVFHCRLIQLQAPDGQYRGQVLLLTDVTRIKEMESEMRENERLAAVGRMAAGVAHEVRNPLSSIKGLALLLKNKFSEESREYETSGLLIQEVERMNRTISELLSFARPASLDLQEVDICELLAETLKLVTADTRSEDVRTSLDCVPDLPKIMADRDRLSQVFINILLNGIQAMETGGTLEIHAETDESGSQLILCFKDTGKGIPSEHLGQVFLPYFTTRSGGTGIGLAISRKIIVDHGGTIRLESEPGRGTTVIVELG